MRRSAHHPPRIQHYFLTILLKGGLPPDGQEVNLRRPYFQRVSLPLISQICADLLSFFCDICGRPFPSAGSAGSAGDPLCDVCGICGICGRPPLRHLRDLRETPSTTSPLSAGDLTSILDRTTPLEPTYPRWKAHPKVPSLNSILSQHHRRSAQGLPLSLDQIEDNASPGDIDGNDVSTIDILFV